MRTAFLIVVASLGLTLTGCAATVAPENAAKAVTDLVSRETKFKPTDVTCPNGVKAEVGAEFECTFTGPDGDYVAHVRVTKVNGDDLEFYIKSELQS